MIWRVRGRDLDLSRHGMLMGVLNVTPDSFSDGGCHVTVQEALRHALQMTAEGADIIDIGGESTRPGSHPVPVDEELRRVLPVVRALRSASDVLISVDTSKSAVARAALESGADIINDVTGLRGDPAMARLAAEFGAGVVIMHMQGEPGTMQIAPSYGDVVSEVGDFFRQSLEAAITSGVDAMSIALDPGIGFGKTFDHNRALIRALPRFCEMGRPLLVGVSRKSFLGTLACSDAPGDRFWPGVALTSICRELGARILRVHDVRPHREALRMSEAIIGNA